jgi:hypothetical protein
MAMTEKVQVTLAPGDWPGDAPLRLKVEPGVSNHAVILTLMYCLAATHNKLIDDHCDPKISTWLADGKLADAVASGKVGLVEDFQHIKLN